MFVISNSTSLSVPKNEDGTYSLIPGESYAYTVTKVGFAGIHESNYIPVQSDEVIEINAVLTAAEPNPNLDPNLDAQWPTFRANRFNNGVVDYPIPTIANDSVLYWATQFGSGYGSNACSCPIIVDDFLYVYAGTNIYKIDKTSGEALVTKSMAASSSFAINSPTYADGMIDENVLFTVKATVNPEFSGTTPVNVDVNRFVNLPVGGTVTDIEVHTTNGSVNASLPEYTLTYTVNGEFYAEQTYAVGAAITVPEYTVPEGYTFSGWVVPETMPAENLTVDAVLSINVYTVTFVDGFDGSVIAEVSVEHGSNVTAPAAPAHDGYVFTGWNGSLVNVTENRTVTAEYSLLGDVDGDGVVTSADALTVLRMSLGIIATPVSSSLDFSICDIDGSGDITSVDALLIIRKAMQSA